jgi:hypothetical protein
VFFDDVDALNGNLIKGWVSGYNFARLSFFFSGANHNGIAFF